MTTTIWNPSETFGQLIKTESDECIILENSDIEGLIPETDGYLPETTWTDVSTVTTTWTTVSLPTTTWMEV